VTSRWARFVRGWATALVALFAAAFSHVVGGGEAPSALAIVIALAFSVVACVALAGKTLSLFRLVLSVGFSQLAFHLVFGIGAGSGSALVIHGSPHHGTMMISSADALAGSTAHAGMAGGASMWIAHAVAAAVTILAIRRGELAFWTILRFAGSRLIAAFVAVFSATPIGLDPTRARAALATAFLPTDLGVFSSILRHRGPPRLA
jgi:hypothetical protein